MSQTYKTSVPDVQVHSILNQRKRLLVYHWTVQTLMRVPWEVAKKFHIILK